MTTNPGRQANVNQHGRLEREPAASETTMPTSTATGTNEGEKYQRYDKNFMFCVYIIFQNISLILNYKFYELKAYWVFSMLLF